MINVDIHKIKKEICDIGDTDLQEGIRRRPTTAISLIASAENQVVCTPTLMCKGYLKPDDLCIVDMEGKQIFGQAGSGRAKIMLHLAIMKERPEDEVGRALPFRRTRRHSGSRASRCPQCVLPEVEIFLGDRADHEAMKSPGGQAFAEYDSALRPQDEHHHSGQPRHGELRRDGRASLLVDGNPRRLLSDADVGPGLGRINYFSEPEARALLDLKQKWGFKDPRNEMNNCDICANDVFRNSWKSSGVERKVFDPPTVKSNGEAAPAPAAPAANGTAVTPEQEALIQMITDRVMAALKNAS